MNDNALNGYDLADVPRGTDPDNSFDRNSAIAMTDAVWDAQELARKAWKTMPLATKDHPCYDEMRRVEQALWDAAIAATELAVRMGAEIPER